MVMEKLNWNLILGVSFAWMSLVFLTCGRDQHEREAAEHRAERAESEVRILRRQLASDRSACDVRVHALRMELDDTNADNATLTINSHALSHDVVVLSEDLQRCRGLR